MSEWKPMGQPGFFGKKKFKKIKEYNEKYGEGNWKLAWEVNEKMYDFDRAIMLYEDAYFQFLLKRPRIVIEIIDHEEVYDNAVTNVHSGLDYHKQENNSNHYQDISIRRVLVRMGLWFRNDINELLHLRHNSKQELGRILSPGRVPFHLPHLITNPEIKGWWERNTIEDLWQRQKCLIVKVD